LARSQRPGEIGRRFREDVRGIGDYDAAGGGGVQLDVIEAHGAVGDDAQLPGALDQVGADLVREERERAVAAAQVARQLVGSEPAVVRINLHAGAGVAQALAGSPRYGSRHVDAAAFRHVSLHGKRYGVVRAGLCFPCRDGGPCSPTGKRSIPRESSEPGAVPRGRRQGLSPNGDCPLPGGYSPRGSAFPLGWQRLPQRDRDSPRPVARQRGADASDARPRCQAEDNKMANPCESVCVATARHDARDMRPMRLARRRREVSVTELCRRVRRGRENPLPGPAGLTGGRLLAGRAGWPPLAIETRKEEGTRG